MANMAVAGSEAEVVGSGRIVRLREGAQTITRHGVDTAVVFSVEEFRSLA